MICWSLGSFGKRRGGVRTGWIRVRFARREWWVTGVPRSRDATAWGCASPGKRVRFAKHRWQKMAAVNEGSTCVASSHFQQLHGEGVESEIRGGQTMGGKGLFG